MFKKSLFIIETAQYNIIMNLFVFLQAGVELLGQIVGYIQHPRFLLTGSADGALIFTGLLVVVLLFSVFAVAWRATLQETI